MSLSWALKPLAYLSLPLILGHEISSRSTIGRYYVRLILYLSTLGICSVWGVIVSVAMSLLGERFNINYIVARSFYLLSGKTLGIRFKVEGEEHLTGSGPAILVGNHQSMLDIIYIGRIFPKRASIMAKRELKWTPLLGQFMLLSGAVFVNRSNSEEARKSMAEAGQTMKRQRTSLWIFPEGTRTSQETAQLLKFKKGAFHLAIQAGLPIIPVVCENYWRLYRKGVLESGTLRIRVLPPIQTNNFTTSDVDELAVRTRDEMLKALMEISQPNFSRNQEDESTRKEAEAEAAAAATLDRKIQQPSSPSPGVDVNMSLGKRTGVSRAGTERTGPNVPGSPEKLVRGIEGSETSSVSGEYTEEEEGMVLVGRPSM